jgi:hypothetical protein
VAWSQGGSSARRVAARRRIGKAGGAAGGIKETPTPVDPCGCGLVGREFPAV